MIRRFIRALVLMFVLYTLTAAFFGAVAAMCVIKVLVILVIMGLADKVVTWIIDLFGGPLK